MISQGKNRVGRYSMVYGHNSRLKNQDSNRSGSLKGDSVYSTQNSALKKYEVFNDAVFRSTFNTVSYQEASKGPRVRSQLERRGPSSKAR